MGVLQFDVLKYRLNNEYNVEIRMENLPYEHIRWIENKDIDVDKIQGTSAVSYTHLISPENIVISTMNGE